MIPKFYICIILTKFLRVYTVQCTVIRNSDFYHDNVPVGNYSFFTEYLIILLVILKHLLTEPLYSLKISKI